MSEIPKRLPALRRVTDEIEQGTASLGWDRPPTLYALVPTARLVETPDLPEEIARQLRDGWDGTDTHLSAVMQESFVADPLEQSLAQISWPDTVSGAVVSAEMVTLPPSVEADIPLDPEEAAEFVSIHPARREVRFTVAVLRSGEAWCEIRSKEHDDDASVAVGENLVPGLVQALRAGLS